MDYSRRKILISTAVALIGVKSLKFKINKSKVMHLEKENILSPGQVYSLPLNPKLGTKLTIVTDRNCMDHYPEILFSGELILGQKENLTLDSMAIFELEYKGPQLGWSLV